MKNNMGEKPKVAIVHDYLVQYGGGEKTVEAICEIFPDAPIYTAIYKPDRVGDSFKNKKIITPGEHKNKLLVKFPILAKYFTFMLPLAFENFDFSDFDIVITSSSGYAKGVLTKPEQLHISYIHTPPRFLYGYSVESTKRDAWYYKPVVKIVDHFLRIWDYLAAQRADTIITNSKTVQKRIRKFYGRNSTVIYPPVDVDYSASHSPDNLEQPYYIALGRLAAYKNFDLVISGFNLLGFPLKVIGIGAEEKKLKKLANKNIEFLGRVSDEEKHQLLENALGLIFPVEDEDLGIVPIEAIAHGLPVLAHKSGGPTETVRENIDGMFFEEINLEHFVEKVREFDRKIHNGKFNKNEMKKHAQKFAKERFKIELKEFIDKQWELKCQSFQK